MSRLGFCWVLGATFLVACGARTDDLEPGSGFGFGDGGSGSGASGNDGGTAVGGSGGRGGSSGSGARPASGGRGSGGSGGVAVGGSGSVTPRGGTAGCFGGDCGYAGYGGFVSGGGYAGFGGFGIGGFGVGGSAYCQFPECGTCGDCMSACTCYGNNPASCKNVCSGAGGSSGCDPTFCPAQSIPVISNPFPGCCTYWGTCGVDLTQLASFVSLPSGCQDRNQPFGSGTACPELETSLGTTFAGCCRADGTCGADMSVFGIGCAVTEKSKGISCSFGGAGGTSGTGGFPATGGVAGSAGFGGSSNVTACLGEARTDCERCACSYCTDLYLGCFSDQGCPEILQCVNQTGCVSSVGCYTPGMCQTVIDKWGISSPSVSEAVSLYLCLSQNSCSCGF